MDNEQRLIREVDYYVDKLVNLRVPVYAAARIAEEIGPGIYALCMKHGREDLRYAMADITSTLLWLQKEIFAFRPLIADETDNNSESV